MRAARGSLLAGAMGLVFVLLPLGTTPLEVATILAAIALVLRPERRVQPLVAPALALTGCLVLATVMDGAAASWRAALAGWAWALAVVVPGARAAVGDGVARRLETLGLGAAAVAAVWALVEVALTRGVPVDGPFSHHLTLGYALLPPLLVAAERRRWAFVAVLGVGVLSAGSSGPLLALVVGAVALYAPPAVALGGGVAVAVAAMVLLTGDDELWQRVVLWTAGAEVAVDAPGGHGVAEVRAATAVAQHALVPGFHFPAHAHDSALQAAAVGGFGAWAALAWLLVAIWRRTGRAGKASIAALAVGSLTQDTLGDLEVVRALCAWALWTAGGKTGEPPRSSDVGTGTSHPEPLP